MRDDQIAQLYRLAKIGKLSLGIFHDLITPLNAVIANIEKLETSDSLPEARHSLDRAVAASRRMGEFLNTVRKQLGTTFTEEIFSATKELGEAVSIINYKAQLSGVTLILQTEDGLSLLGNPLKFHQIALNLISNAIDAYDTVINTNKMIRISLCARKNQIALRVIDYGCGIPKEIRPLIFNQFFTTKGTTRGTGLGLSIAKTTVENDFGGTIYVKHNSNSGTSFSVYFPIPIIE